MTKADIIAKIVGSIDVPREEALAVVEEFMKVVKDSLAAGEPVYLRGFGSFILKHRAEKIARNITKNESLTVPAHNIPYFKPSDAFADMLK